MEAIRSNIGQTNRCNNFLRHRSQTRFQTPDPLFCHTKATLGSKKCDFSVFDIIQFLAFRKEDMISHKKRKRKNNFLIHRHFNVFHLQVKVGATCTEQRLTFSINFSLNSFLITRQGMRLTSYQYQVYNESHFTFFLFFLNP